MSGSPAGILCGMTCAASYAAGTTVTLAAYPDPGWNFTGWSGGGCAGTAPTCTVSMSQARAVTATFAPVP